ncbi:AbrB/MazE/SpoVT family DNA-binding domain-containing protein [Candidatus Woesearchaeota archaeon]|nr:AbrB/MazE/SpoVT family DNA-binding domain-containing protein [Candidatus Woesearchaeota archaeon]
MKNIGVNYMEITAKAKRWGDSLGIILPKKMIDAEGIKPDDTLKVEVFKEADFSGLFGTLKTKISGQKLKDMAREGWGK